MQKNAKKKQLKSTNLLNTIQGKTSAAGEGPCQVTEKEKISVQAFELQ